MPHVLATFSLVLLLWSRALTVSADQVRIANYDAARDLFWHQLYPNGGTTLSCGEPFARQHTTVNIEHVYAASWMTQFLGCDVAILFRTHGDKELTQHTRCVR